VCARGQITDTWLVSDFRSPTARLAGLLIAAGGALALIGVLPWIAAVAGGDAGAWPLRLLGAVAFVGGMFVALVGLGLRRAAVALGDRRAEAALDAAVMAIVEADACASGGTAEHACATCDASCALAGLRN
jgi:hypothetical protein